MKPNRISIIIPFILFSLVAFAQPAQWVRDIGSPHFELDGRICVDDQGNSFVSGNYLESLILCEDTLPTVHQTTMGNLTDNLFLAKFNADGVCIWVKSAINLAPDTIGVLATQMQDIEYYDGKIYCVGNYTDTLIIDDDTLTDPNACNRCLTGFVMCLDASTGSVEWSKSIRSTRYGSLARDIVPCASGILVSGDFDGDLLADSIHLYNVLATSAFLLKMDFSGNCIWGQTIGRSETSYSAEMVYDNEGHVYAAGYFFDSLAFSTDTLTDPLHIGYGTFIAKYDTAGNFVWAFGGISEVSGFGQFGRMGLCFAPNGDLYFANAFTDSARIHNTTFTTPPGVYQDVLARIDTSGSFIQAMAVGHKDYQRPSLSANSTGLYMFTAFKDSVSFCSTVFHSQGFTDLLLLKFDFNLNILQCKNFGGTGQERTNQILCDSAVVYFVGQSRSTFMIDTCAVVNQGFHDIIFGKLADTSGTSSITEMETDHGGIQIYPVPSLGQLTVFSSTTIREMAVYNLTGETILRSQPSSTLFTFNIPVSGIYFLEVKNDTGISYRKFIVDK